MYRFLQSMAYLHTLWTAGLSEKDASVQPFHERPKLHVMHHLIEDKLPLWGSPSRSWCYRDEDYVGAVKKIAASSKQPATLEIRVTEKLMLMAGLDATA
jgi:hypothetical protein